MGLDMYLKGSRYMWHGPEETAASTAIGKMFPELQGKIVQKVEAELMYWRKSNAIHQWFVTNVQGGNDDCNDYYVSKEDLYNLLALCRTVLINRDQASELMPTAGGFFFGSTNYGESYFDDIEDTAQKLDQLLQNKPLMEKWDMFYRSSW